LQSVFVLSICITEERLCKESLKKAVVEWDDTGLTCSTYQEFATKAAGGRMDPEHWLYAQYNHGKTKVKDFGSSDDDKLIIYII
jgi:hypothetical protein